MKQPKTLFPTSATAGAGAGLLMHALTRCVSFGWCPCLLVLLRYEAQMVYCLRNM